MEILKYLLVFGGVPKYLEEVRLDRSFTQNMNRLCFSPSSPLAREMRSIPGSVSHLNSFVSSMRRTWLASWDLMRTC